VILTRRALTIGLNLLASERSFDGRTPSWLEMRTMAQRAEEVGFDWIWIPDHLFHEERNIVRHFGQPLPDAWADYPRTGWWEPWTTLTAFACSTTRVQVGLLVACAGYRQPALLAIMADTLDEISGGRVILGLGAGDELSESHTFGIPSDHLVSRFEEAVAIIRGLFRDGHINFEGNYYQVRGLDLRPRGPRPSGPPIMISAKGPRMLGITARFADSWNGFAAYSGNRPDSVLPILSRLDDACKAIGHDPATLERTVAVCATLLGRTFPFPGAISGQVEEMAHDWARLPKLGESPAGFAATVHARRRGSVCTGARATRSGIGSSNQLFRAHVTGGRDCRCVNQPFGPRNNGANRCRN
jgi:alkanesulfonate monooxygenase SsuD/methylene tetrahydromethanopterin reductase-like flavin-dependent oxidoreductase (luciferase family)